MAVATSPEVHRCSAFCEGEIHAEVFYLNPDETIEALAESMAAYGGLELVEARRALEAPRPENVTGLEEGMADWPAWLVRYREGRLVSRWFPLDARLSP